MRRLADQPSPAALKVVTAIATLVFTACIPSDPLETAESTFAVPQLWPPERHVTPSTKVDVIDLSKIPELEPVRMVDGRPQRLKNMSLGEPTVLLPEVGGTYYPAEHALTDRRALVRRIDEDRHGRSLETLEGYLVDFEDGVVERFSRISPRLQYSTAGIGLAWQEREGVETKVLVHGKDGLVVPLWPESDTAPNLLIHPRWAQAWIFGVERVSSPRDDDPKSTELRSTYVHWTDLRSPPPDGPKVVLPFLLRFDPEGIEPLDRFVHGPTPKQQADVPFVLRGNKPGCGAVELGPDGTFHCRYDSYRTFADGWSYTHFDDEDYDAYFEARNRTTGEVQIVQAEGEDCKVELTVMEPPRALVVCESAGRFIWSPSKIVHYDIPRGRRWTDLERFVVTLPRPDSGREMTGYRLMPARPYHGSWLFTKSSKTGALYASRVGEKTQRRLPTRSICPSAGFVDWNDDDLLLGCWKGPTNPNSLVGLDLDNNWAIQLPGADSRESLVTRTHVLSTRSGQHEVVAWRREPVWPPASSP